MFKFVLNTLIMLSLSAIIYLVARTLPKINDSELKQQSSASEPHRLILLLEKVDDWLKAFFEKLLRRIRVWVLKLDNLLSRKLARFRKETIKESAFPREENKEEKT